MDHGIQSGDSNTNDSPRSTPFHSTNWRGTVESTSFQGTNIKLLGNVFCECNSVSINSAAEPSMTLSSPTSLETLIRLGDTDYALVMRLSPSMATSSNIPDNVPFIIPSATLLFPRSLDGSTSEPTNHTTSLHISRRRSFPKGTIAAIVLAAILTLVIIAVAMLYFLCYRPSHQRRRNSTLSRLRHTTRRNDLEEAKDEVLDISAEAIARERAKERAEMRQWAEEVEGRTNGWNTLNRLGLTFKKSTPSSSPGEDRISGSGSDRSSSSRTGSAGRAEGRKPLIWKRSWGSLSRRNSQIPNHPLELEATRSISTVEGDKENSEDTDSLRFAPILGGVLYVPPGPMPHPYTNHIIPQVAVQPPTAPSTPLTSIAPVRERLSDLHSSCETSSGYTAQHRRGSRDDLISGGGFFTSIVRSLSPRTSEAVPKWLQSNTTITRPSRGSNEPQRGKDGLQGRLPIDSHSLGGSSAPLPRDSQGSADGKRLSVHFQMDAMPQGRRSPRSQTLNIPPTPRADAMATSRDRITSFLDLDSSSKESSVHEQNNSSPTSMRHPQSASGSTFPPQSSTTRPELSLQEPKSGWSSSTPSTNSQPSPVVPETSRWSDSIASPTSRNVTVGSGTSSSSVFPYPVSLPPSPYHPEHLVRRQPSALLIPTEQSPVSMIPSDVPRHASLSHSMFTTSPTYSAPISPSEIRFRHIDDITDAPETSSISSHPPPNPRPQAMASDSYIVQHTLGRPTANPSLTPLGRGVDIIP